MSDFDFGMEAEELSFNDLEAEDLSLDLTDEELEDQDEDFVDLAPLYVQDVDNVGEVRV